MSDCSHIRKRCDECGQKVKLPKKTIRKYEAGVRTYPDGRQRCLTKLAWRNRREEVWERDQMQCVRCGDDLGLSEAHIHHKRKRSLGRDDRASNLETLCESCHLQVHMGKAS